MSYGDEEYDGYEEEYYEYEEENEYTEDPDGDYYEPESLRDKVPPLLAIGTLLGSFLNPWLLPIAAITWGNCANKRANREKAEKIARKLPPVDDFFSEIQESKGGKLTKARLTHTFSVDGGMTPLLPILTKGYNTADVIREIDYTTGTITGRIKVR